MRRNAAAIVVVGLVLAADPSSAATTPVLDGKRVTNVKAVAEAPTDAVGVEDPALADVVACSAPRCTRLTFVYAPAKGVTTPLSVRHKQFYVATTDTDLYLLKGKELVASCTGYVSNARYLQVAAKDLKPGATYTAVMYYSHSAGETVRLDVDLPGQPARDAQHVDTVDPFQSSLTMCGT